MNHITKLQENLLTAVQTSPYHEKTIVFGEGAEAPLLMMIGEAPGGDEEKQGRPFVGKAGKNLSAFLEVVGLKREEIYISNVVKLRPTKESPKTGKAVNRPPSAEEIAFFLPFLQAEIQTIAPKVLVTLGNVPLKAVTGEKKAVIGDYHGRPVALADGRILFALYHPAAVIYNRSLQAVYDADLLELKAFLQREAYCKHRRRNGGEQNGIAEINTMGRNRSKTGAEAISADECCHCLRHCDVRGALARAG